MSFRWTFYDPVLSTSYTVPFNPNKMSTPYQKRETSAFGVSPIDGWSRARRAPDTPMEWTFSGVTVDQAHYDALLALTQKTYPLTLVDHFGRVFTVRLLSFDTQPKNTRADMGWRHEYTVHGLIYGGAITVFGVPATATALVLTQIDLTGTPATASADAFPGALT